jgi:hypothetical protein
MVAETAEGREGVASTVGKRAVRAAMAVRAEALVVMLAGYLVEATAV